MIIGHGIDIVEINQIRAFLDRPGDHFVLRCFTKNERSAAETAANKIEYLAGRFAAKEAVLKALETGLIQGMALTDVEILEAQTGCPIVALHNMAKHYAIQRGVKNWKVSISHTVSYAVASAIATG